MDRKWTSYSTVRQVWKTRYIHGKVSHGSFINFIDVVAVYERENIKEATAPLLQQVRNTEKQIEDCEKQINAKVEESTKKIKLMMKLIQIVETTRRRSIRKG